MARLGARHVAIQKNTPCTISISPSITTGDFRITDSGRISAYNGADTAGGSYTLMCLEKQTFLICSIIPDSQHTSSPLKTTFFLIVCYLYLINMFIVSFIWILNGRILFYAVFCTLYSYSLKLELSIYGSTLIE